MPTAYDIRSLQELKTNIKQDPPGAIGLLCVSPLSVRTGRTSDGRTDGRYAGGGYGLYE